MSAPCCWWRLIRLRAEKITRTDYCASSGFMQIHADCGGSVRSSLKNGRWFFCLLFFHLEFICARGSIFRIRMRSRLGGEGSGWGEKRTNRWSQKWIGRGEIFLGKKWREIFRGFKKAGKRQTIFQSFEYFFKRLDSKLKGNTVKENLTTNFKTIMIAMNKTIFMKPSPLQIRPQEEPNQSRNRINKTKNLRNCTFFPSPLRSLESAWTNSRVEFKWTSAMFVFAESGSQWDMLILWRRDLRRGLGCTHTHTHRCADVRTHTCTHGRTKMCIYTVYVRENVHLYVYKHLHSHIYINIHTCIHIYNNMHMYMNTYIDMHIYTYIYTHINMNIYIHVYIYKYIA